MTENLYTSIRIIDEKPRKVIVDENGKIINRDPNKENLRGLKGCLKENYNRHPRRDYTDLQLLDHIIYIYIKIGRVPVYRDLEDGYPIINPTVKTYEKRFGSWQKALRLVGLDIDSMVRKGILETNLQKARLFELYIKEHFEKEPIDLSGENSNSPYDGICSKGQIYDAKSSKLYYGKYWLFQFYNIFSNIKKEKIEWYYLGAFNDDYSKLLHVWRVSSKIVENDKFYIGIEDHYKYNIKNMKKYEITEKFKDIKI